MHLHFIVSWFRLDREEMPDPSCLLPGATRDKPSGLSRERGRDWACDSPRCHSLLRPCHESRRPHKGALVCGGVKSPREVVRSLCGVQLRTVKGSLCSLDLTGSISIEPLFMMCFHKRPLFIFSTELQDFPTGLVSELSQSSGAVVCRHRGEEAFVWVVWNQWAKLKIRRINQESVKNYTSCQRSQSHIKETLFFL